MAPRIQVYNAIACSSLATTQPNSDLHILQSCTSPDVAARAAHIQAGVSIIDVVDYC